MLEKVENSYDIKACGCVAFWRRKQTTHLYFLCVYVYFSSSSFFGTYSILNWTTCKVSKHTLLTYKLHRFGFDEFLSSLYCLFGVIFFCCICVFGPIEQQSIGSEYYFFFAPKKTKEEKIQIDKICASPLYTEYISICMCVYVFAGNIFPLFFFYFSLTDDVISVIVFLLPISKEWFGHEWWKTGGERG